MNQIDEPNPISLEDLEAQVGGTVAQSRWRVIDQAMIDQFADLINDHQFIHVDPDRARDTPYGTTVAHGFLTLSIFGGLAGEVSPRLAGRQMSINYGFDRIRFVAPVRQGSKVRATLKLRSVSHRDPDAVDIVYDGTLEVEGEDKPAIVALWLLRCYLGDGAP